MTQLLVSALALMLLAGCTSLPGQPQQADTLERMRAREAEPLPLESLASRDGFFRARAPARLVEPIELVDEAYPVRLDLGTRAPIECWVHVERIDLAASLAGMSEATFSAINANLGSVELRAVDRVDAGAFGEHPFMALDWLYRLDSDDGPRVGQVKQLVASVGEQALYCLHHELGYSESFRRVVGALAQSLEADNLGSKPPYFSQVSTLAIRSMRVGIEHTTLTRDGEGDTRVDTRTSLLIPVSEDTLQSSDIFAIEFTRPDGSLINQAHIETGNGELVTELRLDPQPDGSWAVHGTFQTKPLQARLSVGAEPTSWLGEALALRRALETHGSGAELELARWIPQADPTQLIAETLSIGDAVGADLFEATLAMGGLQAELVVDRTGSIASGSIDVGFANMDIERVFVGGTF